MHIYSWNYNIYLLNILYQKNTYCFFSTHIILYYLYEEQETLNEWLSMPSLPVTVWFYLNPPVPSGTALSAKTVMLYEKWKEQRGFLATPGILLKQVS